MLTTLAVAVLVAVLVAAVLALMVWRAEVAVRALAAQKAEQRARELALEERRLALEERRQADNAEMPPMPMELVMRCNAETEVWAREQMRSVIQQLWAKHRDWDGVRAELSAMDAASLASEMGWSQSPMVS